MSAKKIIAALLRTYTPLTSVVPSDSMYSGIAKQGAVPPMLVVNEISRRERRTVGMHELYRHHIARMQVTVVARNDAEQARLVLLVGQACSAQRGRALVQAGVVNVSVLPDLIGPDMRDDGRQLFMQTHDFQVSYSALA